MSTKINTIDQEWPHVHEALRVILRPSTRNPQNVLIDKDREPGRTEDCPAGWDRAGDINLVYQTNGPQKDLFDLGPVSPLGNFHPWVNVVVCTIH
jgi:hypothetical protein